MNERYFGSWSTLEDVKCSFFPGWKRKPDSIPEDFPTDNEILFASYGGRSYEGDAQVVYKREGKLFEVDGYHCSCHGLEDGWSPEETSLGALQLQANARVGSSKHSSNNCARLRSNEHEPEAIAKFFELFGSDDASA